MKIRNVLFLILQTFCFGILLGAYAGRGPFWRPKFYVIIGDAVVTVLTLVIAIRYRKKLKL